MDSLGALISGMLRVIFLRGSPERVYYTRRRFIVALLLAVAVSALVQWFYHGDHLVFVILRVFAELTMFMLTMVFLTRRVARFRLAYLMLVLVLISLFADTFLLALAPASAGRRQNTHRPARRRGRGLRCEQRDRLGTAQTNTSRARSSSSCILPPRSRWTWPSARCMTSWLGDDLSRWISFSPSLPKVSIPCPMLGRVLLLAILLGVMLCAFATRLQPDLGSALNVLYRKGTLAALVLVPALVYLVGVQFPVYVDEFQQLPRPLAGTADLVDRRCLGRRRRLATRASRIDPRYHSRSRRGYRDSERVRCQRRLGEGRSHRTTGRSLAPPHRSARSGLSVIVGGAQLPWQAFGRIRLPAAALNWPTGVVDVMLLSQLTLKKQNAWWWLVVGRCIAACYWPLPQVGRLVERLAEHLAATGMRLARAAYRDPAWLAPRPQSSSINAALRSMPRRRRSSSCACPLVFEEGVAAEPQRPRDLDLHADFGEKWAVTRARREARHDDPYERAYWLIAAACLVAGVGTTLTLVERPPEFEPQFLQVKWQDRMGRRLVDSSAGPGVAVEDERLILVPEREDN